MIGAGTILGNFAARLGLDTQDYARGIINAQGWTRVFGETFTTFVANPLLGAGDLLAKFGTGLIRAGQSAVKFGADVLAQAEAIERLSQQTGASAELLQSLERRLDLAGFASERARQALIKLAQAGLNGSPVFEALGIDPADFANTDQLLAVVLDRLDQIESQSTRTALAMQLFGEEAGPQLVNAVGGGADELARLVAEAERLGLVLDSKAVTSLANLNTRLGENKQAWEGLKFSVAAAFLEGIAGRADEVSGSVTDITAAVRAELIPVARELGDVVADLLSDLREVRDLVDRIQGTGTGVAAGIRAVSTGLKYGQSGAMGNPTTGLPTLGLQPPNLLD